MKQRQPRRRYFIGKDGEGWDRHSESFSTLSQAMRSAFEYDSEGDYDDGIDGSRLFVAKEIAYKIRTDEEKGEVEIIPVGDINSKMPYYLIKDYNGQADTYGGMIDCECHDTVSDKDLSSLLINAGLPKLGRQYHLAHGLELKIGVKSK